MIAYPELLVVLTRPGKSSIPTFHPYSHYAIDGA